MPPAPVTLAPVETRELVEWEEFTGRVEPVETVELERGVSGYITEVHFKSGALVKKDDILFTIDQRPFETKLRAAKAEVQRAEANATAMKREYDRVSELLRAKAIAPEEFLIVPLQAAMIRRYMLRRTSEILRGGRLCIFQVPP